MNYSLKIILCFFFLAMAVALRAQSDTAVYQLSHLSTGSVNRTNDGNSFLLSNTLKLGITKSTFGINFMGGWVYGSQKSGLTNNDFTSNIDFNIFKGLKRHYFWGLGTFDESYSLKLDHRYQAGFGIGYAIFNKKDRNLVLSDGPLVERVKVYDKDEYHTIRNSLRLKYRILVAKVIIFDGTDFWQPSLINKNDYILKFSNNVSVKLRSWLNVGMSVQYNKLSKTGKENLLSTFGFTIEKTF